MSSSFPANRLEQNGAPGRWRGPHGHFGHFREPCLLVVFATALCGVRDVCKCFIDQLRAAFFSFGWKRIRHSYSYRPRNRVLGRMPAVLVGCHVGIFLYLRIFRID